MVIECYLLIFPRKRERTIHVMFIQMELCPNVLKYVFNTFMHMSTFVTYILLNLLNSITEK